MHRLIIISTAAAAAARGVCLSSRDMYTLYDKQTDAVSHEAQASGPGLQRIITVGYNRLSNFRIFLVVKSQERSRA